MTFGGWIFMGISVAFVWVLAIACYAAVLRLPPESTRDD